MRINNKSTKYVIGVHSGHDASACLFKDNNLICAIQKERLTRIKHDNGDPVEAIEYLLDSANLCPEDIDLVVRSNWHNAQNLNDKYYDKFSKVIINYNHHLFHAYSITLNIPDIIPTIIWVVDGHGCRPEDCGIKKTTSKLLYEKESVYLAVGSYLICLEKKFSEYHKNKYLHFSSFDSIGYAYNSVAKTIFKSSYDAGKVMALAAFGTYDPVIPPVLSTAYSGEKLLNEDWLQFINNLRSLNWKSQMAKNLAMVLQNALENYSLARTKEIVSKYKCKRLAICGGVGLNCKNNGLIANMNIIDKLTLFPACDDSGISIGAAVWALRTIYKCDSRLKFTPFLGRRYCTQKLNNEIVLNIAQLLAKGYIIAIFEGSSEFGPRALGHRSILCSAVDIKFKDVLNRRIKKRESFRPFGGIILERNLLSITKEIVSNDYMLSAIKVNTNTKIKYPALVHADGTIRLQIIRDQESTLGKILHQYEEITGHILLINTSFNGNNEPIVETPDQAIICAQKNKIPYIIYNGDIIKIF